MSKKYILTLGQDLSDKNRKSSCFKSNEGKVLTDNVSYPANLHSDRWQFTQPEIDITLKPQLPTDFMHTILGLAEVEVQEPLYYMQTKRRNDKGQRKFYKMLMSPTLADLSYCLSETISDVLIGYNKELYLKPKEVWEPYVTPDRELVRYEPQGGRIMKHKKYNLILGTDADSYSIIVYRKTSRGCFIEPLYKASDLLNKKEYQFTQSEIDSIKSNLDDPKQRAIIDLAKHEVKNSY